MVLYQVLLSWLSLLLFPWHSYACLFILLSYIRCDRRPMWLLPSTTLSKNRLTCGCGKNVFFLLFINDTNQRHVLHCNVNETKIYFLPPSSSHPGWLPPQCGEADHPVLQMWAALQRRSAAGPDQPLPHKVFHLQRSVTSLCIFFWHVNLTNKRDYYFLLNVNN